jgi:hypothetical protein
MMEADEEHHVARLLIAEIEQMTGNEAHYEAKYIVLAESVTHHINEEENKMFPKVRKLKIDFDALSVRLLTRKAELRANGVPADAEARMIHHTISRGEITDTPAARSDKLIGQHAAGTKKSANAKEKGIWETITGS